MKTKLIQAAIWVIVLLAGITGIVFLFGFFLALLAGIIGAGFILLAAGGIISIAERLSEKGKGK
ncbi:hypothetical protein IBX65_00520 [Candidatus Aerophobetes bacterium]|nr:hypothetical protein [Candidatus Aerophobetes bacterium]